MSAIAEFLRARYVEDADAVRANWHGKGVTSERYHGTPIDPVRLLADIEAKTALVDLAGETLRCAEGDSEVDHYGALDLADRTLHLLARQYAGHPDHKGEGVGSMMSLHEFLAERYCEERERQHRIFQSTWEPGAPCPVCSQPTEVMRTYGGSFGPLASFEPCQHEINDLAVLRQFEEPAPDLDVLADLDAKEKILKAHERLPKGSFCVTCDAPTGIPGDPHGCVTVRLLAAPHVSHPDYWSEWRP